MRIAGTPRSSGRLEEVIEHACRALAGTGSTLLALRRTVRRGGSSRRGRRRAEWRSR